MAVKEKGMDTGFRRYDGVGDVMVGATPIKEKGMDTGLRRYDGEGESAGAFSKLCRPENRG
ncbi:MAG: hypothetical protein LBV79_06330 [Candidatus Adiutrix sp.]|jgi:hypothetical protein|nr:hypothetical protein [Candidatus Adiutrix sp.]